MSHHVYNTKGIVIDLYPVKEADKVALIFTKDLGLVYGRARGIRNLESKLSTSLTEFSVVGVSLVKGKSAWRITTVSLIRNFFSELRERREALKALSRVVLLLRTLIKGEEKNAGLYEEIESSVRILADGKVEDKNLTYWEIFVVARILSHLGYLSREEAPSNLDTVVENKRKFLELVNSGIKESGLK